MENIGCDPHTRRFGDVFIPLACVALMLSCSEVPRELTTSERLAAAKTRQETVADYYRPRKSVDYLADLRGVELERNVGKTGAERAGKVPQEIVRSTAVLVAKPSEGAQPSAAKSSAEPPKSQILLPTIPFTNRVRNEPRDTSTGSQVAQANSGEPSEFVATVTAASESFSNPVTPIIAISQVEPKFPADATLQGISAGVVPARLAIDTPPTWRRMLLF